MKRFIIYSFLLIIGFHTAGYLIVFKIKQWIIYAEMEESQGKLETITIPYKYYKTHVERWGKEISWKGNMYDIKKVVRKGSNVFISAIHDEDEESLIDQLAHFLKEKDEKGHSASKSLSKLLKLDFFYGTETISIRLSSEREFNNYLVEQTLSGFPGYCSPPPRLA